MSDNAAAATLRITEIFYSLQGESRTVGLPTVFVRLTGCPMRCTYCDTAYAFSGGQLQTIASILDQVDSYNPRYVTVTGGEPLAQANCWPLLEALCNKGYHVSMETGGAVSIEHIDERVSVVLDIKSPASGELANNRWQNLEHLKASDQVKFVLCDRQDYEWARFKMDELDLCQRVDEVLFSPSHEQLNATELADWIVADNAPVRMQLQMHKYLWNDAQGR